MNTLQNDRLIRALLRQPVDCTPIWIMRQAGRYLPEYRALRSKAGDFMTMCQTPEIACEITLQPLQRFALDAAILFSDILTIPDAMGLELYFVAGEGPKFAKPITSPADIAKLGVPDPQTELRYVCDAASMVREALAGRVPLIGFSGSPWTLSTYMVEGGGSKAFTKVKAMLYQHPQAAHQLLDKLTRAVTDYLNAQIHAGAQVVMIFDTWGGILTPRDYQNFSLQYMQQIVAGLQREYQGQTIPVVLFTKNGGQWLQQMVATGADALGVDWTTDLRDAFQQVGDRVALQGNMEPSILYATPERIREEVKLILSQVPYKTGHVFNLGHGIHQDIPPENVEVLVNSVHELSAHN
ncbi:MAG: uroporphyrinogen decarboxylase [Gammaproteobacteria bacterium]